MDNLILGQIPRTSQQQMLSQGMQQALHVLQMPILELEEWLKNAIEQNPVLERSEEETEFSEEKSFFAEESGYQASLYEHLMTQAKIALAPEELPLAEEIIGNLDERGFVCMALTPAAEEILEKIQRFDPPGIAARNLQESLLLQLRNQSSLTRTLIAEHFEDLMHNRLQLLQKKLSSTSTKLKQCIQEMRSLNFHPAARFYSSPILAATPDLTIEQEEETWRIEVCEEKISFRIAPHFLVAEFRREIASAKWLMRILERRKKILHEIGLFLTKRQASFLRGESKSLAPCTLQELAAHLKVSASTAQRAVLNKYMHCAHGLMPLRNFFNLGPQDAKQLLLSLVEKEDKHAPLSDAALARELERHGKPAARRTVTKYRRALKIAPASYRRKW